MESLRDLFTKKKAQIAHMMQKTSEVRRKQDDLRHSLSLVCRDLVYLFLSEGKRLDVRNLG